MKSNEWFFYLTEEEKTSYDIALDYGNETTLSQLFHTAQIRMAEQRSAFAAEEALAIIDGKRQEDYGTPERNFEAVAEMWSTYLNQRGVIAFDMTVADVGCMMALLKIAREAKNHKRDNLVDAIGYLEITNRFHEGVYDDVH